MLHHSSGLNWLFGKKLNRTLFSVSLIINSPIGFFEKYLKLKINESPGPKKGTMVVNAYGDKLFIFTE
jgi:hypothetical protein